jgi:hypothetical protein
MGGHSAWRKRVAAGEPAKGMGGAIMRHRPHLGRKGKDLILNRKGHIAGGNPKNMKKNKKKMQREQIGSSTLSHNDDGPLSSLLSLPKGTLMITRWSATALLLLIVLFAMGSCLVLRFRNLEHVTLASIERAAIHGRH